MKYVCEICGQQFDRETDCIEHEKACKAKYAAGLGIAAAFNKVLDNADNAKLVIVTYAGGQQRFIQRAEFDLKRNMVVLATI